MKTGAWYVIGFVVAFVYFYVYAVNYIRGVRAEDIELDPVTNIEDFHQRIRRQVQRLQNQPPHHAPHRQMPFVHGTIVCVLPVRVSRNRLHAP